MERVLSLATSVVLAPVQVSRLANEITYNRLCFIPVTMAVVFKKYIRTEDHKLIENENGILCLVTTNKGKFINI